MTVSNTFPTSIFHLTSWTMHSPTWFYCYKLSTSQTLLWSISSSQPLTAGVVEGSVLRPLYPPLGELFYLYDSVSHMLRTTKSSSLNPNSPHTAPSTYSTDVTSLNLDGSDLPGVSALCQNWGQNQLVTWLQFLPITSIFNPAVTVILLTRKPEYVPLLPISLL